MVKEYWVKITDDYSIQTSSPWLLLNHIKIDANNYASLLHDSKAEFEGGSIDADMYLAKCTSVFFEFQPKSEKVPLPQILDMLKPLEGLAGKLGVHHSFWTLVEQIGYRTDTKINNLVGMVQREIIVSTIQSDMTLFALLNATPSFYSDIIFDYVCREAVINSNFRLSVRRRFGTDLIRLVEERLANRLRIPVNESLFARLRREMDLQQKSP